MPILALKESQSRRNRSYEPGCHPPRHHDERGAADHVGDHLRHRQQAAETLGLLPGRRGDRRHRRRHDHLHPRKIARQHHPVPVRRAARGPVHQELRGPRDERTPQMAWRPAKRQAIWGFTTGLLLLSVVASDLMILITVGVNLVQNDASLLGAVPFVAATIFIAALPVLSYLLSRRRAERAMPKVRDWMNKNSWLVNIIVYVIFIVLILS